MSRSSQGTRPGPEAEAEAEAAADLRAYRRLFAAYATALLGAGLAVVGLSLLAFDLTGEEAGVVIAAALSIKVFAYVAIAPLAEAVVGRTRKRRLLVTLDLVRAAAILALYFVDALWQLYLVVFVFTAASAVFTPNYQALVPWLIPDPEDYARALAKSRVVSELENGVSPLVAAAVLLVLSLKGLFVVAMAVFVLSAALLLAGRLPDLPPPPPIRFWRRITLGPRLLALTPALRGLAPLHLAAALASAMVLVNTVGWVQGDLHGNLGLGDRSAAFAFAAYGLGSIAGAVAAPWCVGKFGERATIFAGGAMMVTALGAGLGLGGYAGLLALWTAIGTGTALALTPTPLLLIRVAPERRYAPLHAALFALGNAALLIAYPAAAALGRAFPPDVALFLAAIAAAAATAIAFRLWPDDDAGADGEAGAGGDTAAVGGGPPA